MIKYIKQHKWKIFIFAILYIIAISSIITGPSEIKIIFSILLLILITINVIMIIKFFKNKKLIENLKEFEDWELSKYGFNAQSKKEIEKRIEEYLYNPMMEENKKEIYHKQNFLTNTEKSFYIRLKQIFENKYIIQAQIPLRKLIEKNTDVLNKYANELHKYIDFGIFDDNFNILVLIELNDYTHNYKTRMIRDSKVQEICKQANIPLITLTNIYNLTNNEIKTAIEKEIYNERKDN